MGGGGEELACGFLAQDVLGAARGGELVGRVRLAEAELRLRRLEVMMLIESFLFLVSSGADTRTR